MIEEQSIEEISSNIQIGILKSEDVVKSYLEKIEKYNSDLNAIISLRSESEIFTDLKKNKDQFKENQSGLLYGLPVALKDITDAIGFPTSFGCIEYKDYYPEKDSIVTERLKKEGAIVIGKTNTAELAYGSHTINRLYGSTANPYDTSKSAGGSSGGAGAAVSSGMLPFADGTDMMGSIRNPAAYSNLYGFRPTPGLIPENREETLNKELPLLSTLGGLAKTPNDLSLFFDAVSGSDSRDPYSFDLSDTFRNVSMNDDELKKIKIGWLSDLNRGYQFENGILEMCEKSLNILRSNPININIEEVRSELHVEDLWNIWKPIRSKISFDDIKSMELLDLDNLCHSAHWEYEEGSKVNNDLIELSIRNKKKIQQVIDTMFENFDFLTLPSAQVFPFDIKKKFPDMINSYQLDTYHRWMEVSIIASLFELPVLSVPLGLNEFGLPMGMQIIGKKGSDLDVMSFGKKYESIFNYSKIKPKNFS